MQVKLSLCLPVSGGSALIVAVRSSKLPMCLDERIFLGSAEVIGCTKGAGDELQ